MVSKIKVWFVEKKNSKNDKKKSKKEPKRAFCFSYHIAIVEN